MSLFGKKSQSPEANPTATAFEEKLAREFKLSQQNIWENLQRERSPQEWADFYAQIAGQRVYGKLPETEPQKLSYQEFKKIVASVPSSAQDNPFEATAVDQLLQKFNPTLSQNQKEGETPSFQNLFPGKRLPKQWVEMYNSLAGFPVCSYVNDEDFPKGPEQPISATEFHQTRRACDPCKVLRPNQMHVEVILNNIVLNRPNKIPNKI